MKRKQYSFITLCVALALLLAFVPGGVPPSTAQSQRASPAAPASVPERAQVGQALRNSPVMFIENVGQFPDGARFQVRGGSGTMWLAEDAIWITIVERLHVDAVERFNVKHANVEREDEPLRSVNLKLSFPGTNPHPRIEPFDRLDTVVSYFIGNDPDQWHPDVPVWGGVRYVDLYPGVDLVVGAPAQGQPQESSLPWRLEVRDGADSSTVRLRVDGAQALTLDGHRLRLTTAVGELALPLPTTHLALLVEGITSDSQLITFHLRRVLSPEAADDQQRTAEGLAVDRQRSAVIQDNPSDLLYATFLGGGGSDHGDGIAVDGVGRAYVTGWTASSDFPTTPGAFDTSHNGSPYDAFVVRLNGAGSGLDYATFLGGSGYDEGDGIAVDGVGRAYVTGCTVSFDFPTTPGAFDTSHNGWGDAFVVKLNAAGTALEYATFLGGGGSDHDDGIAVDGVGRAYVTGYTFSSDFPTTVGAFDPSYNGSYDAFVARLNAAGTGLEYATFLGGGGGYGIAVDGVGRAYVTGWTVSFDFPTTAGAFDTSYNGSIDAYAVRLNAAGTGLEYATFLGGSLYENGDGIAVDGAGRAYVTGYTSSSDFPTTAGAFDPSYNGSYDAFVARLNAAGTGLEYATFLGGGGSDHGYGIAVDGAGRAYVAGYTFSSDFPTTVGAFDTSYNDDDTYVARLNAAGTGLDYATFLGGSSRDWGYGIAVDGAGRAYVTGYTTSSDFPPTAGAFDTSYNGGSYGGDVFVAKLAVGGGPGPFTGTISPIYPTAHDTVSTAMQGGTAYRHFRLTDSGGSPIPNATVALSTGETAISDASGYFTAAIQADELGGLGDHIVSVESVTYGGQTYFTQGEPSFEVQIIERRYVHSWECGAVRKASGGVSRGLVAYLSGEVNGGMALTLEESDPDATDDDQVTMAENYTGEAGAGFGVDFSPSIEGGLVKVQGPGSHLVGELLLRTEASVSSTFSDPYQKAAREAQGLMLLAGIADSITGFPGQPFLADILARANITLPYDEVTVGAGVHEQVDLGIDGLQLSFLIGKRDAELNAIDLNLLAATGDMTVMTGHRYYDTLVSEFCVLDLSWQSSGLSTEIGPIKNLIGNYVGEYVATVEEEVFYDQNTGQVNRIELSITGEGNDLTFTDIDQNRVTTRYIIPGDQIDQAVLNAAHNLSGLIRGVASSESADLEVGNAPIIAEINGLLGNVDFAEYEIIAEDGAQLNLVPEIGLEGTILKIDLGVGVELKQARQLVYQQGVLLNGEPYPTASYQSDGYVSRAGKNWLQLTANAVGGLWDLVKDAFNWVWQQVTSGMGWVIGTVSKTVDGIIRGGAQVIAPTGTQLYATGFGPQAATIRQVDSITLTAVGWVPTSIGSSSCLGLSPAVTTASGEGFVVGGIYEFQPYTLAVSPAATLVITYTDEAAAGVDESRIGMFRWNLEGNNWQPMAAQIDLANNTFTASITQLGTFALGYDGTPPEVSILTPADGSIIANPLPLISALVVDTGVGINPATVQMRLDGQVVPAEYITGTGQLLYLPGTPLADGLHTVTVSAADVVGNPASTSTSFQVEIHRVYLPLVLRNF